MSQLAHHVFFTLRDPSDEATDRLVAACHRYLDGHDGVVYFAAGRRTPDLQREVNDTQFHVSLHVVFRDRATHDAYQTSARHQQFIEEQKPFWAQVRVFDSDLSEGAANG